MLCCYLILLVVLVRWAGGTHAHSMPRDAAAIWEKGRLPVPMRKSEVDSISPFFPFPIQIEYHFIIMYGWLLGSSPFSFLLYCYGSQTSQRNMASETHYVVGKNAGCSTKYITSFCACLCCRLPFLLHMYWPMRPLAQRTLYHIANVIERLFLGKISICPISYRQFRPTRIRQEKIKR